MRFIIWNLPSFSGQGASVRSRMFLGTSSISILLACMTVCLASSVDASCKTLVANGQGQRSAQQVRQYIDCMRFVENSYFKRSGRSSYPDLRTDVSASLDADSFTNTDEPFTLIEDSNLASYQDGSWLSSDDPTTDDRQWLEYIVKEQSNILRALLKQSDRPKNEYNAVYKTGGSLIQEQDKTDKSSAITINMEVPHKDGAVKEDDSSLSEVNPSAKGNQAQKPPVAPKPQVSAKPKTHTPDRASMHPDQTSTQADIVNTRAYPKEPGAYYFDGATFIQLPDEGKSISMRNPYCPGSDFLEVRGPSDASIAQNSDESDEIQVDDVSDSESEENDEDGRFIQSKSTVVEDSKGFKSLNINIKLNLSDIVRQSKQRRNPGLGTTAKRAPSRSKGKVLESPPLSQRGSATHRDDARTGKHTTSGNMENHTNEQADHYTPLLNKSRLRRKQSVYDDIDESVFTEGKPDINNTNKPEVTSAPPTAYKAPPTVPEEVATEVPPIPPRLGKKSISELNIDTGTTEESVHPVDEDSAGTNGSQEYEEVKLCPSYNVPPQSSEEIASRCLQHDAHIKQEVETLKEQPWFFMFTEKKQAKQMLMTKQDNVGNFILVCEKPQRQSVSHFTLCVCKDGEIQKLPIRMIIEMDKAKYRITDDQRTHKHLSELIEHYTTHTLPFIDVKLQPWTL